MPLPFRTDEVPPPPPSDSSVDPFARRSLESGAWVPRGPEVPSRLVALGELLTTRSAPPQASDELPTFRPPRSAGSSEARVRSEEPNGLPRLSTPLPWSQPPRPPASETVSRSTPSTPRSTRVAAFIAAPAFIGAIAFAAAIGCVLGFAFARSRSARSSLIARVLH